MMKLTVLLLLCWIMALDTICLPGQFAINGGKWRPIAAWNRIVQTVRHSRFNVTLDAVPCRGGCCAFNYTVRRASADLKVLEFMLLRRSEIHDYTERTWGPDWVLDAGANIGVFSAQLCLLEPTLHIVAVELDRANFRLLRTNTGHCTNLHAVQAAVWGNATRLGVHRGHRWGPPQWQYEAAPTSDAGGMLGVPIEDLMAKYNVNRFQLAKIDIEGAEKEVFSSPTRGRWLKHTDEVLVEIHEDSKPGCLQAVQSALTEANFAQVAKSPDKETWRVKTK